MPKKIALFYGHVASNIGDLAVNRGTISLIRKACPGAAIDVVLLSHSSHDYLVQSKSSFSDHGDVRFVHIAAENDRAGQYLRAPESLLVEAAVDDADAVLLSAGEHLFEYHYGQNESSLFWRLLPAYAAKKAGKKCILLPSTTGPFETSRSQKVMSSILPLLDAMAVREEHSASLLKARFSSDAPSLPDAAFLIPRSDAGVPTERSHKGMSALVMRSEAWGIRLEKAERTRISKHLRESGFDSSSAFRFSLAFARRFLEESADSLQLLVQSRADKDLAEAIIRALEEFEKSDRLRIVRPTSLDDYVSAISGVDRVVSSRFHALVLGMWARRPVYGVHFEAHGHKIPGLFEQFAMPGGTINLTSTPPETAAQAIMDLMKSEDQQDHLADNRVEQLCSASEAWLKDAIQRDAKRVDPQVFVSTANALSPLAEALLMDEVRSRVQIQKGALESRLSNAERRISQLETERNRLVDEVRSRGKENEAVHSRLTKAENQITELQSERNHLRQAFLEAFSERERSLAISRYQADVVPREFRSNIRWRIGKAIIDAQRSRLSLLRLPVSLYRIWRSHRGAANYRPVGGDSCETVVEQVARGGLSAADRLLSESDVSSLVKAEAYAAVTRYLLDSRVPDQALEAAHRAYYANPRESWRTWLAFQLDNCGESANADALLATLGESKKLSKTKRRQAARIQEKASAIRKQTARKKLSKVISGERDSDDLDNLFAHFWEALWAQRVVDAYQVYTTIKQRAEKDESIDLYKEEFANASKERVVRLALLELADTETVDRISVKSDRICYVLHNALPYSSGGYATRAQGLAEGLQDHGWHVFALGRPGYPLDMKTGLSEEKLELDPVVGDVQYYFTAEPQKWGSKSDKSALKTDSYIVAAADVLVQRFKDLRPAVVVAASNYLTALPALIAARRLGLPFIYEVRGFWEITTMSRKPSFGESTEFLVERLMEAGVAARAEHVFTLTEPMKAELMQRGLNEDLITLLPNSCDPDIFQPMMREHALAAELDLPQNVLVIGYVGSFVDYEGLEDLAEACGRLKRQGYDFRLLLVGSEDVSDKSIGPIGQAIRKCAMDAGYLDWLIMPGRVPQEDVPAYYSLVDIAPFPRKPWPVCEMVAPMKPLEAMAMEKAVLVSDVEPLSQMVERDETAAVFRKGDVESLKVQLGRLLTDHEFRTKLGRNGRRWVIEERSWRRTSGKASERIVSVLEAASNRSAASHGSQTLNDELSYYRIQIENTEDAPAQTPAANNRSVYFLHGSFPYQSGGYATRTHGIVHALNQDGYDVRCYTRPSFPADDPRSKNTISKFSAEDEIDGIVYRRLEADVNRLDNTEPDYMMGCIEPFVQVLKTEKPAIVHCRSTYLIAVPALIAARKLGLPFVYEVSGLWELVLRGRNTNGQRRNSIGRMEGLESFVIQHADALVTITEQLKQELIRRGGQPDRIFLAPNSVDARRFAPSAVDEHLKTELSIEKDDVVIGYIGTFVDYEGLDDLVRASARLIDEGCRVKLLLVGSGATKDLKKVVREVGMESKVLMVDRVGHEEVGKYYAISDILAYPRKPWDVCETVSPMKPFEAMAQEKAVLASDVEPLRDIIQDGSTGKLFQKGNLDSLLTNLRSLVQSKDERMRLGRAARQWVVRNRTWRAAGKEVSRAYELVLVNGRSVAEGLGAEHATDETGPVSGQSRLEAASTGTESVGRRAAAKGDRDAATTRQEQAASLPGWWSSIDSDFAARCGYVFVPDWSLSSAALELEKQYISRFGDEAVRKRIPPINWRRADICNLEVTRRNPSDLLDIGSGLGEFVNLFASTYPESMITSVDLKDYSLWFESADRIERIYKSIFDLGRSECRDVVTCFEVIEHLPPERVAEAVALLRSLARRKLFVSVPFMEPPPLYKGHFTRFTHTNLLELFPDGNFTILGKSMKGDTNVRAWIMCEVDTAS